MNERVALAKFACPACGGEANWNPAKQKLVCPFCGTESPAPPDAERADRRARSRAGVARAWRSEPRGWQAREAAGHAARAATRSRCSIRSGRRRTASSAARRSSSPTTRRSPRSGRKACCRSGSPRADARDRIRRWYGKLWLAPTALKQKALTDTVHGVYLPYWTFDAQVRRAVDRGGGPLLLHDGNVRAGRADAHAPGAPCALGAGRRASVEHFFDDDLVCASVGMHPRLLRGIEPFPTQELKPYDAGYVAGWVVERYQIDLPARRGSARARRWTTSCWRCAPRRSPATRTATSTCARTGRGQTFKHILAPVWLLTYDYGRRSFQCVMNGVTGAIARRIPEEPVEDRGARARRAAAGHRVPLAHAALIRARFVERPFEQPIDDVSGSGPKVLRSSPSGRCAGCGPAPRED